MSRWQIAMSAPPDLDAFLHRPAVRTHHRRTAPTAPEALWRAAQGVRLSDTGALGRLVRWRIPDTPAEQTYDELFRAYPFTLLDEGPCHAVSGLCGRIWTLTRDYPALAGPDEFAAWSEPNTVRVLFAHWASPAADGTSELCSEARVEPVGRAAALRLRALWAVIGRFEPLVGSEPLAVAARRASAGGLRADGRAPRH
jgi:hypothetical protein